MARDYPLLLDLVGGTPIVRLDKLGQDVEPTPVSYTHLTLPTIYSV